MLLRIFTEPQQGASYDTLLARGPDRRGPGIRRLLPERPLPGHGRVDGLPGPTDAWVTLAGIARETERIRLGTLVTSATFRLPGPLAISVAEVDAMSGGRVELGLGAGWYDAEHTAYGIPFPALGHRFERLEEQLAIVTGLWATPDGERFTFEGDHYVVVDSPGPAQAGPTAGSADHRGRGRPPADTPRLAATYASEFNLAFRSLADTARPVRAGPRRLRGRRAATRSRSSTRRPRWCAAAGTTREIGRRAAAIGRQVDELREHGLCGTPDEVLAKLATYADAGAARIYLQVLDLGDLDHLGLVGRGGAAPLPDL